MREVLGGAYEKYLKGKKKEWADYSQHVHEWEREQYLPNIVRITNMPPSKIRRHVLCSTDDFVIDKSPGIHYNYYCYLI